ncbi:MAG: YhdH/YhfP family quinone oxidoreductase [Smithellaceae bacterium]|nr:YhdH/YhfP family quinone oxidoreductase [Smithellaceae bacterium]
MEKKTYQGLVVRETEEKKYARAIEELSIEALPAGDVLVRVLYSSLNYKDMLSATGNKGVTKKYPHTPGIDAAGIVETSSSTEFKPGDEVIVTSYDLGMNTSGGLGQYIRVPAAWVVRKPTGLTLRESMIFGTAGFTAALSVLRLTDYGIKAKDDVLVTGAAGGVGGVAVSMLSHAGFNVTALNSLLDERVYLTGIGAANVIEPADLIEESGRPLLKDRWTGCVDTLGGNVLTSAIRSIRANGAMTCCGNVVSHDIHLTVYPFILRGVSLFGIDSQNCPMPLRLRAWGMLAGAWKFPWLERLASEVRLSGVEGALDKIRSGNHQGRIIVNLWD